MAERISPETGLPVGALPTPVGVYDFSKAYESIQSVLDKIGQGQAKLAEKKEKDKIAWENVMMDFPEGDYIQGDEEWIQEAVDAYNDKAVEYQTQGLNLRDLDPAARKELNRLEREAKNRAAKAKENMKHLYTVSQKIELDNGVNFDQGYATQWVEEYKNMKPEDRVVARQSIGEESSPYQKNYTEVDVVNRAAKAMGQDIDDTGKTVETFYNIDKIVDRIEADSTAGIGRRMYERNRLDENETPRQFAERMGILGEKILKAQERQVRSSHGRTTSAGVYIKPDKLDIQGDDATGAKGVFTDPNRQVNALLLKGPKATMAKKISFGDPQSPGNQVSIFPTSITIDAYGNYWVHGSASDLAGSSLDRAYLLTDEAIKTINFQYDMDIVADMQAAEQAKWDEFAN
jgi:hypothetical protein